MKQWSESHAGGVIDAACSYIADADLPLQGKRVVSEKPDKKPVSVDIKGPADDGQAKSVELPGRGKQPPHANKRDPLPQVWISASPDMIVVPPPLSPTPPPPTLCSLYCALMFLKIDVRHVGWTHPS